MMRYLLVLISCLIAACLGFFINLGKCANSPEPYPEIKLQGGCIAPVAPNENIRLDLMQVTIRLKRDSYAVDAVFNLFNAGETTTEMVGVPKYGEQDMTEWRVNPRVHDFLRFDAWVDGQKTEFKDVRQFSKDQNAPPIEGYPFAGFAERPEPRWMVKRVTFSGRSVTTIRVRYEALYHYILTAYSYDVVRYYCSPGRHWKGNIRKATFVIDTKDIGVRSELAPGPREVTPYVHRYEMREYKPPTSQSLTFFGTGAGAALKTGAGRSMPNPCSDSSGPKE